MKKFFAILLITLVLCSFAACQNNDKKDVDTASVASEAAGSVVEAIGAAVKDNEDMDKILIGDVDFDGNITIMDATKIQKYVAQEIDFDEKEKLAADTDGNTVITNDDATAIQEYLVKENEKVKLVGDYVIQ